MKIRPVEDQFFHLGRQMGRQTNMKLFIFSFRDVLFENNNNNNNNNNTGTCNEYFGMDYRRAVTGKITTLPVFRIS
jgi:hypothetical protein